MPLSVAGKTAIITGGGSGINRAFARLLLQRGCSVLIADIARRPEAQSLLNAYPYPPAQNRPFALFHPTDVTSWPQLTSLWSRATNVFDSAIDIVVPGAGLFEPAWSSFWDPPKSATNLSTPSRDNAEGEPGHYAVLDVNLTAPIRLSQMAIAHWTSHHQKGCLVHVGSMAGYSSAINTPLYFASKHGLHGFVRSLAGLRDELGIRAGCVAPGTVMTPMWSEDPSKVHMIENKALYCQPDEIAEAMYDLVVDEELGNGTIYECSKGSKRVIPEHGHVPTPVEGAHVPGYVTDQKRLYERLKTDGVQV